MSTDGLCLEMMGVRDGRMQVCTCLAGHSGDHDPDAVERAEAAAEKMVAAAAGPRETGDGKLLIDLTCSQCGLDYTIEVPDSRFSRTMQDAIRRDASLCEQCADIAERAAGEASAVEVFENRLAASKIPVKWRRLPFDALEQEEGRERALAHAGSWAQGEHLGLVLWGPVGRGKTSIAAAAANAMLHHRRLRWVPVSELMLALRGGFDSPEYQRAMRTLDPGRGGAGLAALVLDDLDKLKPTEHQVAPLYTAINAWIEAEAPLMVTLNRDLDDLAEWLPETFAEPIASRLAGYCKVAQVKGRDRRLEP